jgi:uncharacterized protein involved in response to NO
VLTFYLLAARAGVSAAGGRVDSLPLWRSAPHRPLLVLFVLWACDAVFLLALRTSDPVLAITALRTTLNVVLLLITIIGGRIVPAFTGNALRGSGIEASMPERPWLERAVIALMAATVLVDAALPLGVVSGVLAAVAGLAQLLRLAGWHSLRTLRQPIVWVLHAAYAWLPLGLLLKACHLWAGYGWAAFWMHALGAGAAATMIVAVMSRASLGTGAATFHAAMAGHHYWSWRFGARVSLALLFNYRVTILAAGSLWLAAFLSCAIYAHPLRHGRGAGLADTRPAPVFAGGSSVPWTVRAH